jgi:hypothetical protein
MSPTVQTIKFGDNLAVTDETGGVIRVDAGMLWVDAQDVGIGAYPMSYGTTLPASPANGQEAILVDSTTAPTYQWRFRYNGSSGSTYKWEYLGGAPKIFSWDPGGAAMNNAAFATASAWYWWVNPVGSVFPVPRNGDYRVVCKMWTGNTHTSGQNLLIAAAATTTTPSIAVNNAWLAQNTTAASSDSTLSTAGYITALVAGTHSVGMAWQAAVTTTATALKGAYVEITPGRVA